MVGIKAPTEVHTTFPWSEREKIKVNGFSLVYTNFAKEGMVVRLPGGRKIPAADLYKNKDLHVVMPQIGRED